MMLDHTWIDIEVAVATQSPGFLAGDCVLHFVGGISPATPVHTGRLTGRIIGEPVLEEASSATVAVPDGQTRRGLADSTPPDPEEHTAQRGRAGRMIQRAPLWAALTKTLSDPPQ